jgi:hypothetical protein
MRSLLCVGIAILLPIIIFLFKTHLDTPQTHWGQLQESAFFPDGRTQEAKSSTEANAQNDSTTPELTATWYKTLSFPSIVPTTPGSSRDGKITLGDRIIVVGKMAEEDTDWVINELPE